MLPFLLEIKLLDFTGVHFQTSGFCIASRPWPSAGLVVTQGYITSLTTKFPPSSNAALFCSSHEKLGLPLDAFSLLLAYMGEIGHLPQ